MAIAFELVYELEDVSGDVAETSIKIPTTFQFDAYTEFGRGMASFLDAILGGKVNRASLRAIPDLSGLTGNAVSSTADVEDVAAFVFQTADGRPVRINVPGYDETRTITGSDDIDLTDPDIAAFVTAVTAGVAVTAGTAEPCDVAEDDIVSLVSARERFRSTS